MIILSSDIMYTQYTINRCILYVDLVSFWSLLVFVFFNIEILTSSETLLVNFSFVTAMIIPILVEFIQLIFFKSSEVLDIFWMLKTYNIHYKFIINIKLVKIILMKVNYFIKKIPHFYQDYFFLNPWPPEVYDPCFQCFYPSPFYQPESNSIV